MAQRKIIELPVNTSDDVYMWSADQGYRELLDENLHNPIEEVAIALTYNGLSHLVMMVTPYDLEDFAVGFSASEGLIQSVDSVRGVSEEHVDQGLVLHIEVSSRDFHQLKSLRRYLQGRSGCGLCGQNSLAKTIPDLEPLQWSVPPVVSVFQNFRSRAHKLQVHGRRTGGMHAAFLLNRQGEIVLCREDIGRHNALDKLLGAALRQQWKLSHYCGVVTSRCSVELVQKAVKTGLGSLATLSPPSGLAITMARKYGLNLIYLPRHAQSCLYSGRKYDE